MKKIDLVMLSKLGLSDGGRETWLNNFLNYIYKSDVNINFNLITLEISSKNILEGENSNLVNKHYKYNHTLKKIPIPLGFIFFCLYNFLFKKKESNDVLAVGGLNEAIATVFSYFLRGVSGNKILWLRTIYTKEKGYRLNKFTQNLVLRIEIFLIKNFFNIVIANGDDTASFYRALGVECTVIKNSIDLKKWNTQGESNNSNILNVAFIGRLSEVKGIQSFLDAINLVEQNKNMNDINFHIIGEGPYLNTLEKYEDKALVHSYGAIPNDEVPILLQQMDVCVALTYLTNFLGGGGVSNALIEQMAAGKIIVCWDNNIFRQVLDDESAYFIKQGDSLALVKCLLEIKNNRKLANKKAERARFLSQQYSIENHVESFFKLVGLK